MEKILADNSRLCVNSETITLNGVSIPDYYWLIEKEKQKIETVIRTIKKLGFNTIRIPILPGHFLFYTNYLNETIKNIVDLSAKYKLYCILDWHAIGNPLHNQTRLKEYFHIKNNKQVFWYSANVEIASMGLDILSRLFGEYKHVIFEIYNEPCPAEKDILQLDISALPWEEWRKIASDLISTVRKNTKNLILVSSNYWSFNLKSTSEYPFNEYSNIAYSFHCYPFKNNKNWKEMLDSMKEFPVVVTEFGYDTNQKSQYNSSYEDYLKPFLGYLRRNRISWIGWCFSSSWRPRIVSKWQPFGLSDFGKHLTEQLD